MRPSDPVQWDANRVIRVGDVRWPHDSVAYYLPWSRLTVVIFGVRDYLADWIILA